MKDRLKEVGWTGWTALALALVLFVGSIIAVNTKQPEDEVKEETTAQTDDGNWGSEPLNVTEDERTNVPAPVVEEEVVSGDTEAEAPVEKMPVTGPEDEEDWFEYSFDWR